MADKKAMYEAAAAAGHDLPDYDDITGKELEALLSGGGKDDKPAEKFVVANNRKNPVRCAGVLIEPQGRVTLTESQLNDERLMAKINHGIKTGVFSRG